MTDSTEPEANDLARVAHIGQENVYSAVHEVAINRGTAHGVKEGDRYLIYGIGPEIVDPTTDKPLGKLEVVRGRGQVVHTQQTISTIRCTDRKYEGLPKKITRTTGFGILGQSVVEEQDPARYEFEGVKVGDYARLISRAK
jgi:hypothetical protein